MFNLPIPVITLMFFSPGILFLILMYRLRYKDMKADRYCKIYLSESNRITCPRDGMNQHIEICKVRHGKLYLCEHYRGFSDDNGAKYILCDWHNRLGGWNG